MLQVLGQLEAGPEHDQPMIEVWNKVDLLGQVQLDTISERAQASLDLDDMMEAYPVSCHKKQGLEALTEGIERAVTQGDEILNVEIPPHKYDVRAWLHKNGYVMNEKTRRNGNCEMQVRLSESDTGKLRARHGELIS